MHVSARFPAPATRGQQRDSSQLTIRSWWSVGSVEATPHLWPEYRDGRGA